MVASFYCEKCESKFTTKPGLDIHIATIHERKKPHQCKICEKKFSRKFHLKLHNTSVHGKKQPRPYDCKICNANFLKKPHLRNHTATVHEGEKPFECNLCKLKLTSRHGLRCEKNIRPFASLLIFKTT